VICDWWPSTVTAARRIIIVAQRLEGSRFIAWQLYQQAASGSRERPLTSQSPNALGT